jgi:hypothetical protein
MHEICFDTHTGRYYVTLFITRSTTVRDIVDRLPAEAKKHWHGRFIYYKFGSLSVDDRIRPVLEQNASSIDIVSFLEDTIRGGY